MCIRPTPSTTARYKLTPRSIHQRVRRVYILEGLLKAWILGIRADAIVVEVVP